MPQDDLLKQCHREMNGRKVTGVDKVTKDAYETKLEENLSNLVTRLKRKNYRPQPSLRVYTPQANGKMRPLGIAAYEDKLVQDALSRILSVVFEGRLHDSMHGFRPNRNCHTALRALNTLVEKGRTNYVVDADIKGGLPRRSKILWRYIQLDSNGHGVNGKIKCTKNGH